MMINKYSWRKSMLPAIWILQAYEILLPKRFHKYFCLDHILFRLQMWVYNDTPNRRAIVPTAFVEIYRQHPLLNQLFLNKSKNIFDKSSSNE